MAVNTQFAIAVHIMAVLGYTSGRNVNSCDLAASVNTSASFVRRVLARLSAADLIKTATGKGGSCWLAKKPKDVSLLDIYEAVAAPPVFAVHKYPVKKPCPISCNIKMSLNRVQERAQKSLEKTLAGVSLADFIADLKRG